MGKDKSMVEFDQWIICPECESAMVGEVGEECFICGVECVATPLYPETGEAPDQADSVLDAEVWG